MGCTWRGRGACLVLSSAPCSGVTCEHPRFSWWYALWLLQNHFLQGQLVPEQGLLLLRAVGTEACAHVLLGAVGAEACTHVLLGAMGAEVCVHVF